MQKWAALLLFLFQFSIISVKAQITVDSDQLSQALKDKMMDEITNQITSSIQSGEAWVANESYFSIVLEPFEPFGIDPSDPNFILQAKDIHDRIQTQIDDDPSLTRSGLLREEVKGIVAQGLQNYASSYIDEESFEIYDQCSNLYADGQQKITDLLKAAEGISYLEPDDEDYQSEITSILMQYGIESDYFYLIDDLDRIVSVGYENLVEPLSALSTVASAMSSDDPVYKIEMLFELGETFGGKVPIIGDLITPLFTLGKGVLSAAKGLENVLERNLNQGCINSDGGTYASTNPNKRTKFISKFPNAGRVCPINQKVYNPVYNNIYTGNDAPIYFYIENKWQKGKTDGLHAGQDDIFAAIQWLRQNGYSDKATDLKFIYSSYQKEYGWKKYTQEIREKVNRIYLLFQNSYSTVNTCNQNKLEEFYMEKIDFNWVKRLLASNGLPYEWKDLRYFSTVQQLIEKSMIRNYYLSGNHHNLNHLDRIIGNLEDNVPVNIYGTVLNGFNNPIAGATLEVNGISMFSPGDLDHKIVTSNFGNFSYYLLMRLNNNQNITVSASTPDGQSISKQIPVEPDLNVNSYFVDLWLPYEQADTASTAVRDSTAVTQQDSTTTNNPDNSGPGNQDSTAIDINERIRNSDCANDPYATALWDPVNELVVCTCADYYIWDDSQKKCVPDIQAILDNSDCSQYPNTQPVWDYSANEPICDCKPGYVWNQEYTACVEGIAQQIANSDCSGYLNSQPVWDESLQEVVCDCLPGFKWNSETTACIPEWEEAIQNADCSGYANSEPVWDPVAKEIYCDCLPGYEWSQDNTHCVQINNAQTQIATGCSQYPNTQPFYDKSLGEYVCDCLPGYRWNSQQTGCVPERNKPDINWGDVLTTFTSALLDATNPTYTGGNVAGSGGGNSANSQPPVVHQSNCNDKQEAGGDAPEVHNINLGTAFGSFVFDYNTVSIKDQIVVSQGGQTILNTGCVGESGSVTLNLNGFSNIISVRVNPNCDGNSSGTAWNFTVHCPGN